MKICKICKTPLKGKARKYCPDCKRKEHLQQMHLYYMKYMNRWKFKGLYWDQRVGQQLVGTGSLGATANTNDWEKEWRQIQQELINLNLRNRKEKWNF